MPARLLPQEIVPVDGRQAELTDRHLIALGPSLEAYFLALRAEVDAILEPVMAASVGKPYPIGRCEEINRTAMTMLARRIERPACVVESAIRSFIAEGGVTRSIWGVLRERYFQNAMQFGSLYIDVSNDTVVVTKPKVEILPIADSGIVPVRDVEHFAVIAGSYWEANVCANVVVPSLAPILPMITHLPDLSPPGLQSASDYMIALMIRDGFRQAEDWLSKAPPPPPHVAEMVLDHLPDDLRPRASDPRAEAVAACRTVRAAAPPEVGAWRDARVGDYLRTQRGGSAASTAGQRA
jgi:hypothetical protein